MNKKTIVVGALATLMALTGYFSPAGQVLAANVSSTATASINSDTAVSGDVSLPALTITESTASDIPAGTLTWALPSGFVFNTASVADVIATGGLTASSTVTFADNTHFSVNVLSTSTTAGTLTVGATTTLKVKVTNGTPLAATGNIVLTLGSITGLSSTSAYGTLTQVPGAANKLSFTVQPPAAVATGATLSSATVAVQDQFGNILTADNGRSVGLSVVAVSPTTTSGTLSGTTSVNDTAGLSTFSSLSFSAAGTIQLQANSSGLASVLSNNIVLTATTTPPTSCGLRNGMLVKVAGSPTVYMVVNCVLRPFTTPAIFHARGKKFQDIEEFNKDDHEHFAIGRPIGEGNDDDDTVVIPPSGTTTPPSITPTSTLPTISGLPDGAVVKLPGDPTVYLVTNGVLQPFTSVVIFNLHGKRFQDIKTISAQQFSQLTVGAPVGLPEGALIKGSGSTVFIIRGGKKFGIPSMNILNKHGWSLQSLNKINDNDLKGLPDGGNQD